jgi:diguanylate cyclase (GGDEF)-like protein/PAS domain S-box-containing protein
MLNKLKILTTRLWFRAITFAIFFYVAALLSKEISFQGASFPSIWFPSGVFIAVLLLSEIRTWPIYLLAALPASLIFGLQIGQPYGNIALTYISGALEAATGAWLVRRFDDHAGQFRTPSNVLYLIGIAVLLCTALSATLSTTVIVTLDHNVFYWPAWQIGWIGHAIGVLVVTPLILSWFGRPFGENRKVDPERLIELAILITGLIACSLYIFIGSFDKENYIIIPFLVWVALRFGPRGTTFCGLLITILSAWGRIWYLGGFAASDMTIAPNSTSLGIFLAITLVTCFILTTVWEQGKRAEKALRLSEERYRKLVENQGEGVGIVDQDEVFTFANPTANQIFGVKNLVGHSIQEFTDPGQFEIIRQQTRLRETGQKTMYDLEIIQPNGKRCSLLISATPEHNADGNFSGAFAVFHDNTERRQAEMALRDSRARFQTLFDHSPIPIWEEDFSRVKLLLDGLRRQGIEDYREFFIDHPEQVDACEQLVRVLDVNKAAMQPFGYEDKSTFIVHLAKLIHRGPMDVFIEELVAIGEGKTEFEMEGPNDLVDGIVRHHNVRWTVAPGYERTYRRVIVTIIDMTERKQAEEHMRYLSTHDVLTGLYNRNFFETEMERLQNSRMEPVNVMVIDVNGMKATNDTYGHAAGDELLRRSAQVLRMSFRKEDIIARIGGDEFVVLFHGTISIQDAVNRVKDCLAEHNHWYEGTALSLAIGAASGSKDSILFDLFKKADQQMYKEKLRSRKIRPESRPESKPGNSPQNN